MSREKWTPEFLAEMERTGDVDGDQLVAGLFHRDIREFVFNMAGMSEGGEIKPPPVSEFFKAKRELPTWADEKKIHDGQELFSNYGPLTVTALFCASLPECYVVGDEAAVLIRTGQLTEKTLYRVRQTARFVFAVMAEGGLTEKGGASPKKQLSGQTQTLMVRMIHSIVRHVIEERPEVPSDVGAHYETGDHSAARLNSDWFKAFHEKTPRAPESASVGVPQDDTVLDEIKPINQLQLAFTLLTFSYVIIRSLRQLGVHWTPEEEEAYIHTWNVVGFILGVHEDLMVQSYEEGEYLFEMIKKQGQKDTEAGRELSSALLQTMEDTLRWEFVKPLPHALTYHLIGRETAGELGLHKRVYGFLRTLGYHSILLAIRMIVPVAQILGRRFKIVHWLYGVVSSGLILHLLETETSSYYAPMRLPMRDKGIHPMARMIFKRWSPPAEH